MTRLTLQIYHNGLTEEDLDNVEAPDSDLVVIETTNADATEGVDPRGIRWEYNGCAGNEEHWEAYNGLIQAVRI